MKAGPDPLAGAWVVREVAGVPPPPGGPAPRLEFDGAGRLSGHAGVNRLAGPYSLAGGLLRAGPLVVTRMAGPPEWAALEERLLAVLADPVPVAAAGDALTLGRPGAAVVLAREAGWVRPSP